MSEFIMYDGQAQKTFSVWVPDNGDNLPFLLFCTWNIAELWPPKQLCYQQGPVGDSVKFLFLAANALTTIKLAVAKTKEKTIFSCYCSIYNLEKNPYQMEL